MDTKSINTLEEIADLLGVTIAAKSESELMDLYDDSLDEMMDEVKIGSLTYSPAAVLKEIDPTAYRTGFSDWIDAEGYCEISDGWLDGDDLDKLKEKFKDEIDELD